jgi:plastocyanin
MIGNRNMNASRNIWDRTLTLCVTAFLALGVSACGDDKKSATSNSSEIAETAISETAVSETAVSESAPPETAPAQTSAAGSETADTLAPSSGSASGSPAGGAALVSTEATAANTVLLGASGFSPTTLSVAPGDTVTFKADGKGVFAVLVGDLPGATVTGGLTESFSFSKPGTYSITEEISGNSATITVG